jgi:glycosyltransferase involved in cell wall biosynthesis
MSKPAIVTIAVPSYNQGRFLQDALTSIFDQSLPVEVFVHSM